MLLCTTAAILPVGLVGAAVAVPAAVELVGREFVVEDGCAFVLEDAPPQEASASTAVVGRISATQLPLRRSLLTG